MSGNRYLLDTNAIIQLLKGNEQLITVLNQAEFIAVSIISRLEFLSFSGLSENDKMLYERFEKRISLVDLSTKNMKLLNAIVKTRLKGSLKLPDSIILSSAEILDCTLVTADKVLLTQSDLKSLSFDAI